MGLPWELSVRATSISIPLHEASVIESPMNYGISWNYKGRIATYYLNLSSTEAEYIRTHFSQKIQPCDPSAFRRIIKKLQPWDMISALTVFVLAGITSTLISLDPFSPDYFAADFCDTECAKAMSSLTRTLTVFLAIHATFLFFPVIYYFLRRRWIKTWAAYVAVQTELALLVIVAVTMTAMTGQNLATPGRFGSIATTYQEYQSGRDPRPPADRAPTAQQEDRTN